MIALDNGPPHGDYARYIGDLLERRAAAPLLPNTGFASTFVDPRANVAARSQGIDAAKSSIASGRDGSLSGAQAAAIASAMAMGTREGIGVDVPWLEIVGVLIGVAIMVVGFVVPGFNGLFVLAGVGLVVAMFKRIGARGSLLKMLPGIDAANAQRTIGASRKR